MKYKRKNKGQTNYKKRLELIKSKKVRLVVRKSLKNIIAQLVEYHPNGDKVIISAHTKELTKKYNFPAKRNTPSAYLIGILIALKAKQKDIKHAILDTGLYQIVKGSILFAVLKGAIDAGLKIPFSEEIFPKQERIQGKHTKYTEDQLKTIESIKSKLLKGE